MLKVFLVAEAPPLKKSITWYTETDNQIEHSINNETN